MFTGIIDNIGIVKEKKGNNLYVELSNKEEYKDIIEGESISVNGVCLTVEEFDGKIIKFFVSKETYEKSNIRDIKSNNFVNLERAMKIGDRLSGHIVQGHIEGEGIFIRKLKRGKNFRFVFKIPENLKKFIIRKGSIAINGISLTIADIKGLNIEIEIIPFTVENTNLKYLKPMDKVNVETDIIGKYIYNWYNTVRR
jgi:riboflavin synthase